MSNLISELKYEHSQITDTLRYVLEKGVNSEEGRKFLYTAKTNFLSHLKKEDDNLYPALWKEAENNNKLKHTLELYADDMVAISKMAFDFFDKYESGGDSLEFENDYKNLFIMLIKRILKEETVLYKIYDEILSK